MSKSINKEYIKPFSSNSAFLYWQENNCFRCSIYENTSTEESKSGCKLAFNLDLSSVSSGEISKSIANQIGFNGRVLNRICDKICK